MQATTEKMCIHKKLSKRDRRRGFTLLEVILALAILGGALAVLGEVMRLANHNASGARDETQAQLLADSVMDEIVSGAMQATDATRQPLNVADATQWLYSVKIGTSETQGIVPVEVVVEQDIEGPQNPVKFRLKRWLPSAAEMDEAAEAAQAAQQSGGGQGGQSNQPGGAAGASASGATGT